ncbi:LysR substrate-binding domain-containing protein [Cypionkella sp.]|uniref:LysR substrate-binding domain-containing protein n=1 Tax=Cypionkella sp. TaxID=2811411 RepID=UPI00262864A3|nr:LysR substrate-binding domain-containing protein [Cypionkella sp.]
MLLKAPTTGSGPAVASALGLLGRYFNASSIQILGLKATGAPVLSSSWAAAERSTDMPDLAGLVRDLQDAATRSLSKPAPILLGSNLLLRDHVADLPACVDWAGGNLAILPLGDGKAGATILVLHAPQGGNRLSVTELGVITPVTEGILVTMGWPNAGSGQTDSSDDREDRSFQTLLEAMPDIVLEVDADGTFIYVHAINPEDLVRPREEMLRHRLEDVLPPEVALQRRAMMAELDRGISPEDRTYKIDTITGQRWYSLRAARRDGADARPSYLFVSRNVTSEILQLNTLDRLSEVARRTINLVIVTDTEQRTEYVNDAFERLTGYTLAEAKSKRPGSFLKSKNTDLGAAVLNPMDGLGEAFHAHPLYTERYIVIFPLEHRLGHLNAVKLTDLSGEPYVDRLACELRETVMAVCAEKQVALYARFRSDREDWVQAMVLARIGFAFMPENSVSLSGLLQRPLVDPVVQRSIALITVRGRPHSPAVAAFVRAQKLCLAGVRRRYRRTPSVTTYSRGMARPLGARYCSCIAMKSRFRPAARSGSRLLANAFVGP